MKDLNAENSKILLRVVRGELNKQKAVPSERVRKLNIVKMSICLKVNQSNPNQNLS